MMTEREDFFFQDQAVCTRAGLSFFVDLPAFAYESCIKVAICVRGEVPKFTPCWRQCTVYIPHGRLKKTIHGVL